jgi:hypothetical protein
VEGKLFFDVAVADSSVATITLDKNLIPETRIYGQAKIPRNLSRRPESVR